MKINLNQTATFRLSEYGREIWRKYCVDEAAMMAAAIEIYSPPFTGEETEITLQIWVFISIFGEGRHWRMGGPYVLETMNVELAVTL